MFGPLTYRLPFFASDGIQHDLRGVLRFCYRGFTVINRINSVVGGSVGSFCVDVDDIGCCSFLLAADIFVIGDLIFVGEDGDLVYNDGFSHALKGESVLALIKVELEGVSVITV